MPDNTTPIGPALRQDGRFRNAATMHKMGWATGLKLLWTALFAKPAHTVPGGTIPVHALSRQQVLDAPDNTLFRLGHSTLLLKVDGQLWLTDPVFGQRAAPVSWAGPKRFHQPPISLDDLPPLQGVLLSHNHYDHLDRAAIVALAGKTAHFVTPLGVGDLLVKWGVPAAKVIQRDWWQDVTLGALTLVATPAQHFSGRGLFDHNRTLWASWVIRAPALTLFFSGDGGYFDGFRQIGERYGPFDVTLMETGAYDRHWPDVHMQPEQTLQAHLDLRGRWLLPVHNGTFDLALHAWHEPFDRIVALAARLATPVPVATPEMGQAFDLLQPQAGRRWWLQVVEQELTQELKQGPQQGPQQGAAQDEVRRG